jgi:hypothetical protein
MVNQHKNALEKYAEERISILRGFLENEVELTRIREIQGMIKEVKLLLTLRDVVLKYKENRNG